MNELQRLTQEEFKIFIAFLRDLQKIDFDRTLNWMTVQDYISEGMRAKEDISIPIEQSVDALNRCCDEIGKGTFSKDERFEHILFKFLERSEENVDQLVSYIKSMRTLKEKN